MTEVSEPGESSGWPPPDGLQSGDVLVDRYELQELHRSGGEGDLWFAFDRMLQRPAALKARRYQPAEVDVALGEARLLAELPSHAHLPLVRNAFLTSGHCVVDMDWIDGEDL